MHKPYVFFTLIDSNKDTKQDKTQTTGVDKSVSLGHLIQPQL